MTEQVVSKRFPACEGPVEGDCGLNPHRLNVLPSIRRFSDAWPCNSVHRCSPLRHPVLGRRRLRVVQAADGAGCRRPA